MAMLTSYLNAIRAHGGTLITHIGLVDQAGTELSGGSPAYARKPVTWNQTVDGVLRPSANLTFDIPAGTTVGGWRGYSALTAGTDYGGQDVTNEAFAGQGTYELLAASTAITHTSP